MPDDDQVFLLPFPAQMAPPPEMGFSEWVATMAVYASDLTRMLATGEIDFDPDHADCDCGGVRLRTVDAETAAEFGFLTPEQLKAEEEEMDDEDDDESAESRWGEVDDEDDDLSTGTPTK